MKRSEINLLQMEAVAFFRERQFHLPPWACWGAADWQKNRQEAREVIDHKLGWDLTDFGLGDFYRCGLLLFTLRNGKVGERGGKDYAEKVMIVRENQVTPWHFHFHKMEDIINRGGGELVIELCNATGDEQLAETPVIVQVDGVSRELAAKGRVVLRPGESITLPPRLYHQFYGASGRGLVLVGEVSRVNDDEKDNRFLEQIGRFPEIEADEAPLYYLCHEYPVD
ncbi:MAG: D-lyxose/D-mannose family sugar isomerase [Deferribacteres bacterium]|nr:D-lyxose/D-mannose family sugar isomerase [Deferribacteres bacterium]